MNTDNSSLNPFEQEKTNIDRLYVVVSSLTVAFIAASYAEAHKIMPVHILWLITYIFVIRDWLYNTKDQVHYKTRPLITLAFWYVAFLHALPFLLRLIEGSLLPVCIYPMHFLVLTFISLWFWARYHTEERISEKSKIDKLEYAGHVAGDIMTVVVYFTVSVISVVWFSDGPSWPSVIVFAIAIFFVENMITKPLISLLKRWIANDFLP